MSKRYLGEFEQMVLLAVLGLEDDAYGVRIMEALDQRVSREVSRGSLYVTLDRLEAKGLLRSTLADPTAARGGRRKRFVEVTPDGVRALAESRRALQELWRGLDSLLDHA